uniref:PDZ domain-containing protein n=1 Tax=Globisporangium ultimum (strain ATCC 200006 / CBS 805.95 / DAOM BR144) TaxID=431595 RepID=K3WZC6_GLOUD
MDASRRRILELTEQGEWDDVLELVEKNAALASAQDDFGMLPLHWACTEPSVPLDTLKALLAAFPDACELENLSGMAPLHVAIASKMSGLAINVLLQACPQAAFMKDGSGRYPIELAMENNLPKYTIDLIRKAGARAVRSSSSSSILQRSASFDDANSMISSTNSSNQSKDNAELMKARSLGSLMASRQASEYARLLDKTKLVATSSAKPIGPIESTEISLQLKELLTQLQQLSVDIRTSSSTSGSTYRSSFSSSSSSSRRNNSPLLNTVLWNPSDKLGFSLEPVRHDDIGARIKKISSRCTVLGAETLSEGDVLVSINGTSVLNSSYATITRFLKHSKVTCKLCFSKGGSGGMTTMAPFSSSTSNISSSSISMFAGHPDSPTSTANEDNNTVLYAKVAEMLDATLKKVSAVEETW